MSKKELSVSERELIINLHVKQRMSYSEISKQISRSRSTIQRTIDRFRNSGQVESKARSGRPSKLSVRDKRVIKRMVDQNHFTTARMISSELETHHNTKVHPETVRRTIVRNGFKSCTPRKKPLVNKVNRQKRLAFAKEYVNKPPEFWHRVIFSDESKYNIFGSDGRIRVWRRPNDALNPKCTVKTVKHGGGGLMVWGCMASSGVGKMEIVEGIMNQFVYIDILKRNLKVSAEMLGISNDYYFQQDNDPKHTAHNARLWLLYNTPHQLRTPPQSPDINPIEHVWDALERKIRTHDIQNKVQLKDALLLEWNNISSSYTEKLVASMQTRLKEVIRLKGYPTKY